ncbi:MAG TPA: hypothetical protein VFU47_16985, partial [Armatimonadota bacterium]|nr:hypothetical protein [Armatimonadota bacterium]
GAAALRRRAGARPRAIAWLGAGVPLLWSAAAHWGVYRDGARLAAGALPRERWLARFQPPGHDFSFLADDQVARYVRAHTAAGDPILVWGFEPPVYLLSGRRAPTRFFFDVPVAVRFTPERWRAEFLTALRERPPVLFLVVRNDRYPWATGRTDDSEAQLRQWPELREWLGAHYWEEMRIEDFTIYRRRAEPGRRG